MLCDSQRNPADVPMVAPANAATAKSHVSEAGVCPAYRAPTSPTAELAKMNGAVSAPLCFGDAQRSEINNGARKTPPPTPVSPDTKPTDAPMPSAPHRGAVRSGASSWARRKTSVIDANSRTSPVTVLYRFSSRTTKPPTRAVGKDASIRGLSFAQSTWLPRLNSQVEYDAATTFNSNAVGRISFDGNDAN